MIAHGANIDNVDGEDWIPPSALGRHPKEEFRKAAQRSKAGSAKRACQLDKAFVQQLPEAAQDMLNKLVDTCWKVAAMPTTALQVNICLVEKPAGGWRPIALLVMVYRWMMTQARVWTIPWDEEHSGEWDFATPGKSVIAGIYLEEMETELASAMGQFTCGSLLDMKKFYDNIALGLLLKAGNHLSFPMLAMIMIIEVTLGPRTLLMKEASGSTHYSRQWDPGRVPGCSLMREVFPFRHQLHTAA